MPASKLWFPNVPTSMPMIRSDRIAGVSWKNVDSGVLAPTSLPAVRVRIPSLAP